MGALNLKKQEGTKLFRKKGTKKDQNSNQSNNQRSNNEAQTLQNLKLSLTDWMLGRRCIRLGKPWDRSSSSNLSCNLSKARRSCYELQTSFLWIPRVYNFIIKKYKLHGSAHFQQVLKIVRNHQTRQFVSRKAWKKRQC